MEAESQPFTMLWYHFPHWNTASRLCRWVCMEKSCKNSGKLFSIFIAKHSVLCYLSKETVDYFVNFQIQFLGVIYVEKD